MEQRNCPICEKNIMKIERYPNYICGECILLTVTKKNEKIEFHNINCFGGFVSLVNNVKGSIHQCYVNNIECYADEARFGGIVVSVVPVEVVPVEVVPVE